MDAVNSIVRAVAILDTLEREGRLSFTEILRRMDLPKSTLYKILTTLERAGLVRKERISGRYVLGVKLIELGTSAKMQLEIREVAQPVMKALHRELDYLTINLVVRIADEIIVIECFESENWYRYNFSYPASIGIRAPLHCTGAGKAILAYLEPEQVEHIIAQGLERFTAQTITERGVLLEELQKVRAQGFAVGNTEHDEQIRTIGAPIFDQEGRVIAALSVLGIPSRVTLERVPSLAPLVVRAATEISTQLGYNPRRKHSQIRA
ncbi:MAG: IclR family transcriptional regulator [Spirochaetales bacterium]|nr:IclR family transcriptional regulator [Spirochaetales bacterium]